jgi:DNA-binding IscR family transcriptional regulator
MVHDIWKEAAAHIISFFEGMTLQRILDRNQDKVDALLSGERIDVN